MRGEFARQDRQNEESSFVSMLDCLSNITSGFPITLEITDFLHGQFSTEQTNILYKKLVGINIIC
jgi:hypothetical protein